MDAIHRKHPGQAGMLSLAKLVWWPYIHSDITSKAQGCRHCIDKGKNLKALISKNNLGLLPPVVEPNQEIHMDFAGPIPYKENTQNNYILVTVDRLTRYPHAETFHICDTETAIDYLERYCKQHGIPQSIRCDQAKAFKAKEFEIFCKNKNIKLILAPAGDHRGTGMVERLIQTIKRRLSVLDIDPDWSNETLSSRLANIIENSRLIPNRTTKTTPFEAHFGRKPNTELSNILTKPSSKKLNYNKLKMRCLDKKMLRHNVLTQEEMWRRNGLSEEELDIQYSSCPPPVTTTPLEIDSDDSENIPLSLTKPRKISPSKLHFSIGDKTTKIMYNKKNVARKTIMRKNKEPRPTLAPQWNIISDGTITGYTLHTITIDTPRRENTVIRQNDIAIATETKPLPPPEPKPRLIHMVACKTVGEYKRNKEKIRKFCLEEEKAAKLTARTSFPQGPSSSHTQHQQSTEPKPKQTTTKKTTLNRKAKVERKWSKEKLVKLATKNQRRQQEHKPRVHKTPAGTTKKKLKQSTLKLSFNHKAQQAALLESANLSQVQPSTSRNQTQQSLDESEVSNRSFLIFNVDVPQPNSIQTHLIDSEETGQPQHVILTSNDPSDFMVTSPESPPITSSTTPAPCGERNVFGTIHDDLSRSTKRIDNAMKKIKPTINSPTDTSQADQS